VNETALWAVDSRQKALRFVWSEGPQGRNESLALRQKRSQAQ